MMAAAAETASSPRPPSVPEPSRTPAAARRVLAAGFFAAALSAPGQTYFVSLYVPEISLALGMSAVAISGVYGAATLLGAALLPFLGTWADRWSAARFLGAVVVGLGLSMLALASAGGPLMLAVAWTLARCLGQGAIGVGVLSALSRTFHLRRGRALAIGTLGHPFGEAVFPGVIALLLVLTSWRHSLVLLAGLYVVVFAPLVAVGLERVPRTRMADAGTPDGRHQAPAALGEALRTWRFWTATLVLTAAPVVVTALLFHQVAFFEGAGLSRAYVAIALMYFAAAQVVATVLTGRMVDGGHLRTPLALSCLALIGSVLALGLQAPDAVRVGLYGLTLGYATGAAGVAGAALWPAYFGDAAEGRIRALTSGIRNAATAGAPLAVAVVIDRGDLLAGQHVLIAVSACALLLVALLPRAPLMHGRAATSGSHRPRADREDERR
jgi:sugar phosphate permease